MADPLTSNALSAQPGASTAPTPELLDHVLHMQQMMTVAQSFVDKSIVTATDPEGAAKQLAERLFAGNMSPEAQEIEYQRRRQIAIEEGRDPNREEYPVGTNQFTKEDAATFANRYDVQQSANDATGFSGSFIMERTSENRELVVALRDTEFRPNDKGGNATQDVSGADLGELVNNGAALGQIAQADKWFREEVIPQLREGEQVSISSGSLSGHVGQVLQILHPEYIKTEPNANVGFNPTNTPSLRDPSGQLSEAQLWRGAIDTYVTVRDNPGSVRSWLPEHLSSGDTNVVAQRTALVDRAEASAAIDLKDGISNYYDSPRTEVAMQAVRAMYDSYGLKPTTSNPFGSDTVARPGNLSVIGMAMTGADVTIVPSLGVGNSNILIVPIHGQNAIVTGGSYTDIGNNHGFYTFERPLSLLAVIQEARQASGQALMTLGEFRALAERSGVESAGLVQGSTTTPGATESDSYPNLLNFMRETFLPAGTPFRATTGNSSAYGEANAEARAAWYADIKELQAEIKAVVANGGSVRTIDVTGLSTQARIALALEDSPTGDAVRFALKQGSPVATVITDASGRSLTPQHRGSTALEPDENGNVADSFEDSLRAQNSQYELTIQGREQNNPGYGYSPPASTVQPLGPVGDDAPADTPVTDSESSSATATETLPFGQCTPDDEAPADPLLDALTDAFTHADSPDWSQGTQVADNTHADIQTDVPASGAGDTAGPTSAQPAPSLTDALNHVLPYAQGLNSALSLIQAVQQGNTLSALLAGSSLAGTLNHLTDGAMPALPGELGFGLNALSTGLNLLDALDAGNELGALSAGANLASQAAGLWASASANIAFDAIEAGGMNLAAETAAAEMGALSQSLGQFAGALNIANSLAHGDPLGAAIAAISIANPPLGIALSIGRAIFGGLFGDDDGEPPYVWINATGDGDFVRTEDGGVMIEASGTNRHKSTEGTATGPGTQGGQVVASTLQSLLADLQSQVDAHNTVHPDAPMALIPERLPELHYRDPAYYAQWTDAATSESRSIAVSGRDLAEDLLAVAQSGQAIVPQWLADTITQRIEAGETDAWRAAPRTEEPGDVQSQDVLVLGSGAMDQTARSDIDADGWREAHAWNTDNLYVALDTRGDGRIEGFADLLMQGGDARAANRLGWLDADGDGLLNSNDPGFAALRVWLDANGDAVAQANETAGFDAAGIVAIDFRSYPPALVDATGNATALSEAQLSGETKGLFATRIDGGIQVAYEDGETVLWAERTADYAGDEAHTHREEMVIDVGDARLRSEAAAATVARTEVRLDAGDARIRSGVAAQPAPAASVPVRVAEVRSSVGVAPSATAGQELRTVTAQMISDSQNLFAAAGGLLTVMAFGAGSAQAGETVAVPSPSPETAAVTPDASPAASALPALATAIDGGTASHAIVVSAAPVAPLLPAWTATDIVVVAPAELLPVSAPAAAGPPVPPAAIAEIVSAASVLASAEVVDEPAPVERAAVSASQSGPPAATGSAAGAAAGESPADDTYCVLQPQAGDDVLDDRSEDIAFRITPAQLLANDAAAVPTHLSVVAVDAAEHGRVEVLADGDIAFFPDADYFGPAAFAYTVGNDYGQTARGRVEFNIRPVDDAPAVAGESAVGTEDSALRFDPAGLLANDSDIDNIHTDLRIAAVDGASHGTVALDADGKVRFTPDADYNGTAGFDYTVADGAGGETRGRVEIAIAAVNDAPVVPGKQTGATEDTALLFAPATLLSGDHDVDNAHTDLRITAVSAADHGEVAFDADGNVGFTPDADYNGTAGFDYTVADGAGGETTGHVALTVAAVNDAPVATSESVVGDEDTVLLFDPALLLANDVDVDNDHSALRISAVSGASHGTVAMLTDGRLRFTPDADYFGAAGFDYLVADGAGGETLAHVDLAIAAVNDAPTVAGESADGTEDTALLLDSAALLANDADIDSRREDLYIAAVGGAAHGTAALQAGGKIRFTPDADFFGAAGFDYLVADGAGGETLAHVDLAVAAVNDAPTAVGENILGAEDQVLVLTPAALLANESDIDNPHAELRIAAVNAASHGTVALDAGGNVRFTPDANYFGAAGFDYAVADGAGGATQGHVDLAIAAVNDAPMVGNESVAGKRGVPLTITQAALLANDSDVESASAALSIAAVGGASHGTVLKQADGSIRFTPELGYYGAAGFDYTVADGSGGQGTGHVAIDLAWVNVAPTTVDEGFTGDEDIPFIIAQSQLLANDSDPDGDHADLAVTAVGGAQHGTVVLQDDGSIRFTPTANFYGSASFTYTVADGDGGQTQGTAYLNVQSVNDAPVIVSAPAHGNIVAYDPDGDSSQMGYFLATPPVHGSVSMNGHYEPINPEYPPDGFDWIDSKGECNYYSTQGDPYSGSDPFQIRVTDVQGASTTVWVQATHSGSTIGGGGGGGGCPIAIDLDRDGVELVAPDDSQVFADVNADGWRERIGWIGNDDGLLALDRDNDGRIAGFDEISFARDLPGIHTDLEGLRAHDSDGDGFISSTDAEWSRFGVWRDADGNGFQEDGEFRSLGAMGVARIGLAGDGNLRIDHGNVVFGETRVELATGESLLAADVMFAGAGVAYPLAVQQALALATPAAEPQLDAPPLDEAELARRAQAFVQACAAGLDQSPPLGYFDAAEATYAAAVPDWLAPDNQAAAA